MEIVIDVRRQLVRDGSDVGPAGLGLRGGEFQPVGLAVEDQVVILLPSSAVLFSKLNPRINRVWLVNGESDCRRISSTEFVCLVPDEKRVFPEYLVWRLKSPRIVAELPIGTSAATKSRERFPPKAILGIRLALPPLAEQRRIVDILNRANGIRRLLREALDKARQLIPALFVDTFTNLRGCDTRTIAQLLADQPQAIRTGPFGSQLRHSEFVQHGVPVLGIDNVVTNQFRWTSKRCLPNHRYERFRRFRVYPGDVIVTIMGTAGKACVAPDDLPECMSTKHLCVLSLDRRLVDPSYVWGAVLYDEAVRAQTRLEGRGAIMEGWNMTIVRNLRLSVPPLHLQHDFAARVADIQATIAQQERMLEASDQLVASLMAQLFDGGISTARAA